MKRISVCAAVVLTALCVTMLTVQMRKPPKASGFKTTLTPGAGEILLLNNHRQGELKTALISREGYNIKDELPQGFFYTDYLPAAGIDTNYSYTKEFYLNETNIDNLSERLLKTEINQTGAYMLFKAKRGYEEQVKEFKLSVYSPSMRIEIKNTIGGAADSFDTFGVNTGHKLFDKAYTAKIYLNADNRVCLQFRGYKYMEEPVLYYYFEGNETALTDDNLKSFLRRGDTIEFCVTIIAERSLTKRAEDELAKMVKGIRVK